MFLTTLAFLTLDSLARCDDPQLLLHAPLSRAVNTASRMESTGVPGSIQISDATLSLLPGHARAVWLSRGEVQVKGKGAMRTYLYSNTAARAVIETEALPDVEI